MNRNIRNLNNTFLKVFGACAALLVLGACATKEVPVVASADTGASAQSEPQVDPNAVWTNVADRVYFALDSSSLDEADHQALQEQASFLLQYPQVMVTVEGHCDERGTREYNLALGAQRAEAVKTYLVGQGVDASRITTISYGKERPVDPRSTEEAWRMNRRGVTVPRNPIGGS